LAGKAGIVIGTAHEEIDRAESARRPAQAGTVAIVCVPTFRRPQMLARTLQSLARQRTAIGFAIVVVDNDPIDRAGANVAKSFLESGLLEGVCVVEAQPGNCQACNRGFREARRRFPLASCILMIDDDEIADREWLERMVAAARATGADIVGGPVVPHFLDGASEAFARHPVYWPAYSRSGIVPMIYGSGNFLIRADAFDSLDRPEFDLRYNFLGGGDTDFFTRCRRAGLKFHWEQSARIVETVPADRVRTGWVLKRGLRIGAINFHIDTASNRCVFDRIRLVAKNCALVPVSAFRSLKLLSEGRPVLVCAHPLMIALGRVLAWVGVQPEQYRRVPAATEP
jgi:glycosyltransferase involved in cell wall biosynthesis